MQGDEKKNRAVLNVKQFDRQFMQKKKNINMHYIIVFNIKIFRLIKISFSVINNHSILTKCCTIYYLETIM